MTQCMTDRLCKNLIPTEQLQLFRLTYTRLGLFGKTSHIFPSHARQVLIRLVQSRRWTPGRGHQPISGSHWPKSQTQTRSQVYRPRPGFHWPDVGPGSEYWCRNCWSVHGELLQQFHTHPPGGCNLPRGLEQQFQHNIQRRVCDCLQFIMSHKLHSLPRH